MRAADLWLLAHGRSQNGQKIFPSRRKFDVFL
jgi:hypothetical protein